MSVSSSGSSSNPLSALTGTTSSSSNGYLLSSQGSGTPLQITGLASGLDTNSIIQELMALQQQPLTHLQNQVSQVKAGDSQLTSIQSALQTLASNAQALASVSLFQNTQSATSTDPTTVAASTTVNVGAVVGGYQIAVSQMATASQQTFGFTSPTQADTVTIGNGSASQTYQLQSGATAQDLVNAVNADSSGTVWGTVVNGNIVFSDRTTGSASTFTVSDTASALAQQSSTAGQDAKFTVNSGAQQSSASNTVTTAIPGVSLTFGGITTTTPVTVTVGPPSISTSAVQTAVQNFVSSYNSVLTQIQTQLSQTPSSSDPTQGTLYGDPELQNLLNNMRSAMYAGGTGLPTGMASMFDLGVSTGATTGSSAPSQSAISGQLTLNATTLTQALTSNPSGVTAVLSSFASSFSSMVNTVGGPGGSIDSRMQSDNSQISDLNNQIATMQAALTDKQNALTQQFATLESALSQNQSTSAWLTSQINSLPG
jgi:flagellar hook-associated protein 2